PRERQPLPRLDVADQRPSHLAVGEAEAARPARAWLELDVGVQPLAELVALGHLLPDLLGGGRKVDFAGDVRAHATSGLHNRRGRANMVQPTGCTKRWESAMSKVLVPTVVEQSARGERAFDLYSRLL